MSAFLFYGSALLFGTLTGLVFSTTVNFILIGIAGMIAIGAMIHTRNWEIGSVIGIIVLFYAGTFILSNAITLIILNPFGLDLSFLLRT